MLSRHSGPGFVLACLIGWAGVAAAAEGQEEGTLLRQSRWVAVDPTSTLPADMLRPEGRTRWDLRALEPAARFTLELRSSGDRVLREVRGDDGRFTGGAQGPGEIYADPSGGDAALRWLLPDRDPDLGDPGEGRPLVVEAVGEGPARTTDRLWIKVQRLGSGRAALPSGSREVVLQRALVQRQDEGRAGSGADLLVHRWIDPRAGVVAEIWGRPTADGRAIAEVAGAAVVESVTFGATPLKIYLDEMDFPPFDRVNYGYDLDLVCTGDGTTACDEDLPDCDMNGVCGVLVDTLTPGTQTTIWDLVCNPHPTTQECQATSWDFSGVNPANFPGVRENATSTTNIDATETCSHAQCGFNRPGAILGREDKDFDVPADAIITLNALETQVNAGICEDGTTPCTLASQCSGIGGGTCAPAPTIWLRAAVRNEGIVGSLGTGESRICNVDGGRTEVPLWRFANQDGGGFFMQDGDAWSHNPFDCENTIFNHVCPNSCGLFCPIWTKACSNYSGTQSSQVVNEGVVTLPSGHSFDALVVRNTAEFCVYLGSNCFSDVDRVRTVLYMWQVPHLGTVVRLMSVQNAASTTTFTRLAETDIKFGLFPPRSITVDNVTATTVEISWDPGLDTHRIDGYRVYWDTDSGAPYAFSSVSHPGQVSILGTSATISGLTSGVPYFFTVTAISDYTDPGTCRLATCETTTYESRLFPTQIDGPSGPVPAEVTATPSAACTPTQEIGGLTIGKSAGSYEFCWQPTADPCVDGYRILGAGTPLSDAGFSVLVPDTGPSTCHTLAPAESYFLVIGKGTGGTGPWGHYGR